MRIWFCILALGVSLWGCASKSTNAEGEVLLSMQLVDRNGISETISSKDKLQGYETVDYLDPQPYQKILRVYKKDAKGKSLSKITSYHTNGQIRQYLEVEDGRAHGKYIEWHDNGKKKLEASVIEGVADINEKAQASWLFNGRSAVFNEEGNLIAEIFYEKGRLHTPSLYYFGNGKLQKKIPYENHLIEGDLVIWDEEGNIRESVPYKNNIKEGKAIGFWTIETPWYEEQYEQGLLKKATYYNHKGKIVAEISNGDGFQAEFKDKALISLTEYRKGKAEGQVTVFDAKGRVSSTYLLKDDKKNGQETIYYIKDKPPLKPKLMLGWEDGIIQGIVKTWYENGQMESQKEIRNNKKQGHCFAWYPQGDVQFAEEYESDRLLNGSYFKKGEKKPTSQVQNGSGTVTLFDRHGFLLKKIRYEKGKPLLDESE